MRALSVIYVDKRITRIPVGVVDADNSSLSREASRWIDSTENMKLYGHYEDARRAYRDMLLGKIYGFIYIPQDFSKEIKEGKQARFFTAVDYSNVAPANQVMIASNDISAALTERAFSGLYGKEEKPYGERLEKLRELVKADIRPIGNPQMNYSDFFLPGLMFIIIQQVLIVGICVSFIKERNADGFRAVFSLSEGGVLPALAGKLLPHIILNFIFGAVFIYLLLPHYSLFLNSGPAGTLLFTLLFSVSVSLFAAAVSFFFPNVVYAFFLLMFLSMLGYLLSGSSWPPYCIPRFLRFIAAFIPSTHFFLWIRGAMTSGMPVYNFIIPGTRLLCLTVFCAGLSYFFMRKYKIRDRDRI